MHLYLKCIHWGCFYIFGRALESIGLCSSLIGKYRICSGKDKIFCPFIIMTLSLSKGTVYTNGNVEKDVPGVTESDSYLACSNL